MKKKILVIDDDADVRSLAKIRLEASDFEVILASNGEEGFQKLETEKPNLVIVDIMMPKMDGYTLVQEIKARSSIRDVPIIILTSRVGMKDLFEIEGVSDYITKPYDVNDLLRTIRKHVR